MIKQKELLKKLIKVEHITRQVIKYYSLLIYYTSFHNFLLVYKNLKYIGYLLVVYRVKV